LGGIIGPIGCNVERVSVSRLQFGHWKKWAILTGVSAIFIDEYHFISVLQKLHTGDCRFSTDRLRSSAIPYGPLDPIMASRSSEKKPIPEIAIIWVR